MFFSISSLPLYFSSASAHLLKGWCSGFCWSSSCLNSFLFIYCRQGNMDIRRIQTQTNELWKYMHDFMTSMYMYVNLEFTLTKWFSLKFHRVWNCVWLRTLGHSTEFSDQTWNIFWKTFMIRSQFQPFTETETENLSFWQFLQFLAISALSADLALREPDYRRKSLVPTHRYFAQ